jgi:hypothetical protein
MLLLLPHLLLGELLLLLQSPLLGHSCPQF